MGITKCKNNKCPLSAKCHRYMSKPNPIMQSWQTFKPKVVYGIVECEFFMFKQKDIE